MNSIPFDDDVKFILGIPNFIAARYAHALRHGGHGIPTKAEAEQAYVLHWMLNLYLADQSAWKQNANDELSRCISIRDAGNPAAQPSASEKTQ